MSKIKAIPVGSVLILALGLSGCAAALPLPPARESASAVAQSGPTSRSSQPESSPSTPSAESAPSQSEFPSTTPTITPGSPASSRELQGKIQAAVRKTPGIKLVMHPDDSMKGIYQPNAVLDYRGSSVHFFYQTQSGGELRSFVIFSEDERYVSNKKPLGWVRVNGKDSRMAMMDLLITTAENLIDPLAALSDYPYYRKTGSAIISGLTVNKILLLKEQDSTIGLEIWLDSSNFPRRVYNDFSPTDNSAKGYTDLTATKDISKIARPNPGSLLILKGKK